MVAFVHLTLMNVAILPPSIHPLLIFGRCQKIGFKDSDCAFEGVQTGISDPKLSKGINPIPRYVDKSSFPEAPDTVKGLSCSSSVSFSGGRVIVVGAILASSTSANSHAR